MGQVVLIEELGVSLVRLELLLVRQIIKLAYVHAIQKTPSENTSGIEIGGTVWGGAGIAGNTSGKRQLDAGRAVGSIAEEIEAEQGVVVEHSKRRADYGFAISPGIPSHAHARLNVVLVGLDAFLESKIVVSGLSERGRRLERRWEFDVVAYAIVQCEIVAHTPGILPEYAQRFVGERVGGIADALDEVRRDAEAVCLHGGEARNGEISREGVNQRTVGRGGEYLGGR